MAGRTYIAIDLKSFYASVECVELGRNPLTTHLVVADLSRTEKTICLAVSPTLKAYGIPGRARLFEVVEKVKQVNAQRLQRAPGRAFTGSSSDAPALGADPGLAADYIVATPRMALYMEYSARVYQIYLKYVAPEDIHPYSIDEVFMDVTNYLGIYGLTPRQLARKIILDVLETTGITATAGIGTNLYLCKVALDIGSKHVQPDRSGVRIAQLDEMSYRQTLWSHRPLTDFWRVGRGYAKKLEAHGMHTMGDVARCSLGGPGDFHSEALLYKLFGVNAELLIDHAWGWEPCTMQAIKAYRPESSSVGSGQVLQSPYPFDKARIVVREMAESLALDLVDKGLMTDQLVLTVGFDRENFQDPDRRRSYKGPIAADHYGRPVPKHAHGSQNLERYTSSTRVIVQTVLDLFDRTVDKNLLVRRLNVTAARVLGEHDVPREDGFEQLDLFTDQAEARRARAAEEAGLDRERHIQQAMLSIKRKYGKNAIVKGTDLEDGATGMERNAQIGGHKA